MNKDIEIDPNVLDYSKTVSYYARLWNIPETTLRNRLKILGVYDRFHFVSGGNTATLRKAKLKLEYEKNPKFCIRCENPLRYDQRRYNFCSLSCGQSHQYIADPKRGFKQGQETKQRMKEGTWGRPNPPDTSKPKIAKQCEHCDQPFSVSPSGTNRRFCTRKCASEGYTGKGGGYREGSGRGKSGWYRGIFCNSSWELAWVVYNLDKGIAFERCSECFTYTFDDKVRKYYPDFKLPNGSYVEVKGYVSPQWEAKAKQFPHQLIVLNKVEMKPILDYVIEVYGTDFLRLYNISPAIC